MSYIDALNRIGQLESQLAALDGAPASATAATNGSGSATSTTGAGTSFATQLAQAQAAAPSTANALGTAPVTTTADGLTAGTPSTAPLAAAGTPTGTAVPGAGSLTSDQQQFAARLASDTGLDSGVIGAWLLAEESGGAATARQSANNNDWLNIGYTDSATFGAGDSVWSDPVTAADATAGWLSGKNTIPGYGTASAGVQAILQTAGQAPAAQIAALQGSGWASSGYPDLPALYQQVAG